MDSGEKRKQLQDKLVDMTSPEKTNEPACEWNERIYQITKKIGIDTADISWNQSPKIVAFHVVGCAYRKIGLDKLSNELG